MAVYSGKSGPAGNGWPGRLPVRGRAVHKLAGKKVIIKEALELILHYHTRRHAQTKSPAGSWCL